MAAEQLLDGQLADRLIVDLWGSVAHDYDGQWRCRRCGLSIPEMQAKHLMAMACGQIIAVGCAGPSGYG